MRAKPRKRPRIVQIVSTTVFSEALAGFPPFPQKVPHPAIAALDEKGRIWVRRVSGGGEWRPMPKLPLEGPV